MPKKNMNPVVRFEMPYKKTKDTKPEPSFVIAVDDINKHIEKVTQAGGKIQDIPGVGLWVSFLDTEGNRANMLQPTTR